MKQIFALLIVLALGPKPAFADEPEVAYEMQVIPLCSLQKVGGALLCAYDLETWKKVMAADAELVHLRLQLKNELVRSTELVLQVDVLQDQIEVHGETRKLLEEREAKLTKDLIDLDKKYQDERVKPRWGTPLAWTVAAVSTAILAGVLIKDLSD